MSDLQHSAQTIVSVPENVSDDTHYWTGTEFAEYPSRPGDWAEWNSAEWVDPRTEDDLAAFLSMAKKNALAQITKARGQARLTYITDLPGQDALYMAKNEEARQYVAAFDAEEEINPSDFPLIMSEVGTTAPTAFEVSQVFLNLNSIWRTVAGLIDGACFRAEDAITNASSEEEVHLILNELISTLSDGSLLQQSS